MHSMSSSTIWYDAVGGSVFDVNAAYKVCSAMPGIEPIAAVYYTTHYNDCDMLLFYVLRASPRRTKKFIMNSTYDR
jgi:hypothetical protein